MASQATLKMIVAKKEAIFEKVNDLYKIAKKIIPSNIDTRSKQDFLAASSNIEKLYNNFNDLCDQHNTLLLDLDPDCKISFSNWSSFETLFAEIQYIRNNLLESNRANVNVPAVESNSCRLPPLELISFSGQPESWPLFYQYFKTNVHDNKSLNDGQRVQYLVGKLTGNAKNIFAGIVPNASNYLTIWKSLVSKYQDKRLLGSMYLNNILDIKPTSGSPGPLNNFIEKVHSSWSALRQLDIDDLPDFMFTHFVLKKLDSQVLQSFELSVRDKDIPTSDDLVNYVRHHIKILERTTTVRQNTSPQNSQGTNLQHRSRSSNEKTSHSFAVTEKEIVNVPACIFCKTSQHTHLYECLEFKKLDVKERFKFIKDNKMCINCFSGKHSTYNCGSTNTCKHCHKRHHSLLHFNNHEQQPNASGAQSMCMHLNSVSLAPVAASSAELKECTNSKNSVSLTARNNNNLSCDQLNTLVVLPTAQVYVPINGNRFIIRCLVDSGSQNNLITLACCEKLKLNIQPLINSSLKSVGTISTPIKGYVSLTIQSRVSDAQYELTMLVIDKIADPLPVRAVQRSVMEHFKSLPLADECWDVPGSIDAILGTQMFAFVALGKKVVPTSTSQSADSAVNARSIPHAIETTLGYIVMGEIPYVNHDSVAWSFGPLVDNLNNLVLKFWEIEEVPTVNKKGPESQECEDFYKSTVLRNSYGQYIVSLPFKGEPKSLGNSFIHAQRRLSALERKFHSLPALRQAYNDVINDYIDKGYLSEIPYSLSAINEGYFIPHHAVVRPDKSTTKVRIVLDASAKTDSGNSLNDLLYTGPNLQADLFLLLLNFRYFKVAITADIRQMYLRISLAADDRKYQKILYRFNDSESIRIFQFNSVAFGLRSSPFLAMRTIHQLAEDYRERYPLAADVALKELYMDDLTTSVPSDEDGTRLADELLALFKAGGFDLVKWASNSSGLLAHLPESHRAVIEFTDDDDTLKVLGLKWIPTSDVLSFATSSATTCNTKRAILSTVARLFDVLGFVAPVILYAKLLIQDLWLAKVGWDEEPPETVTKCFVKLKSELPILSNLQIPRHLGVAAGCDVNLLGFGDASMRAYGCVLYLHVTNPNGNISIHLVCAKSKVAPLKTVSLARLELCASLLLAKLIKQVHTVFNNRYPIKKIFAFSDSTIALSWIHSSPHRWQIFVANRVTQIQENLSPDRFFHINGIENPSDCLSRGLLPSQLINHPLWWHGPPWICFPTAEWPIAPFKPSCVEGSIPEAKSSVTLTVIPDLDNSILLELALRVSSWKRLLRILVYVLRFLRKLPPASVIRVSDLETAELVILRELQSKHFADEIKNIKKGKLPSHSLRKLDPFVDDNGLLRVGGRLTHAHIPYESRHPLLLPGRHHLVDLIIDDCHRSNCHTGSHLLMSLLRQRYWIISARNIIRQRIRQCNFCFKVAPSHPTPMMSSLPPSRVQEAKAFTHTGVDYAGPINITMTRKRGVRSQKAYICLFVCLTTKAIHIEIASDLSSETFLDAFKRFLSRRGPVSVLYSDNGTNFIGAKRQLDELYTFLSSKNTSTAFQTELNNRKITWRNIPARAPHWGGIWESNIKCIKTHLYRCIGQQLLCYEELLTVLTQIESVLNSRPLCALSDQPHTILTPAHFLNTTPLQSLPACEVDASVSLHNRKRLLDSLVQSYWKKWHVDYLHTLQLRQKWNTPDISIRPGLLVLIHQDDSPPLRWPTGIVEQVYPGKDGIVRVALVRTTAGAFKRPVVKLCPLPSQ